jgi:hypothetical protein
MKVGFILIIGIFTSFNSLCKSTADTTAIDTTYIKPYEQKMLIKGIVSSNSIQITQKNKYYKPNNPLNVGFSFTLKNTVVDLRSDFGLINIGGNKRGKTNAVDFQIHHYGRHFLLDLFYQNYKGYYREDKGIELYPALAVRAIGAEGSYLFNGNKFSAKAAFDQSEKQLKSVGSFVLGGGAYMYKLNLEKELLTSANSTLNNFQLGMNAGYAYSWVINNRWLMAGSATAGFNFGNEPELLKNGHIQVYPTAFARGSTTYHKSDWAVSFLLLIHNKSVYPVQGSTLNLTALNMEIAYIKHFDNWFKKKR